MLRYRRKRGQEIFVHLPPHPVWFWLMLLSPFAFWLLAWVAANVLTVSLKPLVPWLSVGYIVLLIPYFLLDPTFGLSKDRGVRAGFGIIAWTCYLIAFWLKRRYMFESLHTLGDKWYLPWKSAEFYIPNDMRVLVANIDSVSPWYVEKLGLGKAAEKDRDIPGDATFRYKADGKSIVLTTRRDFRTSKTPILFTKKIGRMKNVLTKRGAAPGDLMRDRQGIHYFEISDPEGNKIEVVEDR
jgi:hypothetical protein